MLASRSNNYPGHASVCHLPAMKSSCCRLAGVLLLSVTLARAERVSPKPIDVTSPGYPIELTDTGLSGVAEVDFVVKPDGTVADAELAMANHRAFGKAALAAARQWKFEPGSIDGAPTTTRVTQRFQFAAPFDQQVNAFAKRKVFVALTEPLLPEKDYPAKKLKVKHPARPVYPRAMAAANVEEKVTVKFVIAPDGTTLNPEVVGAKHKEFETPAIQAVALMSYEPPLKDGKPVYVAATTILNFTAERPDFGGMGGMGGGSGGGRRGGGGGMGGGGGGGGGGPNGN
jgi:TonB family protein